MIKRWLTNVKNAYNVIKNAKQLAVQLGTLNEVALQVTYQNEVLVRQNEALLSEINAIRDQSSHITHDILLRIISELPNPNRVKQHYIKVPYFPQQVHRVEEELKNGDDLVKIYELYFELESKTVVGPAGNARTEKVWVCKNQLFII